MSPLLALSCLGTVVPLRWGELGWSRSRHMLGRRYKLLIVKQDVLGISVALQVTLPQYSMNGRQHTTVHGTE